MHRGVIREKNKKGSNSRESNRRMGQKDIPKMHQKICQDLQYDTGSKGIRSSS
mgnify:FL=1